MMIFVVADRFKVNPRYEEMCEERFLHRVRLVEGVPGFFKRERHHPIGDGWYTSITCWESRAHHDAWRRSPSSTTPHRDEPPAEMFADPAVREVAEVVQFSYSPLAFLDAMCKGTGGRGGVA
jgi:heme-degrading monooxygenase HmoA